MVKISVTLNPGIWGLCLWGLGNSVSVECVCKSSHFRVLDT